MRYRSDLPSCGCSTGQCTFEPCYSRRTCCKLWRISPTTFEAADTCGRSRRQRGAVGRTSAFSTSSDRPNDCPPGAKATSSASTSLAWCRPRRLFDVAVETRPSANRKLATPNPFRRMIPWHRSGIVRNDVSRCASRHLPLLARRSAPGLPPPPRASLHGCGESAAVSRPFCPPSSL